MKAAGSSFCVNLSGFEVFVNEEGTRTFVGLRAISGTDRSDRTKVVPIISFLMFVGPGVYVSITYTYLAIPY